MAWQASPAFAPLRVPFAARKGRNTLASGSRLGQVLYSLIEGEGNQWLGAMAGWRVAQDWCILAGESPRERPRISIGRRVGLDHLLLLASLRCRQDALPSSFVRRPPTVLNLIGLYWRYSCVIRVVEGGGGDGVGCCWPGSDSSLRCASFRMTGVGWRCGSFAPPLSFGHFPRERGKPHRPSAPGDHKGSPLREFCKGLAFAGVDVPLRVRARVKDLGARLVGGSGASGVLFEAECFSRCTSITRC